MWYEEITSLSPYVSKKVSKFIVSIASYEKRLDFSSEITTVR